MSQKPYSVYALWSTTAKCFYIGLTENTEHRLEQHNGGESKWTKRYAGTWLLAWQRQFPSLSQARQFENRLKKQKRGKGFWALTGLDQKDFNNTPGS